MAFAFAVAAATGLLIGTAPALRAARAPADVPAWGGPLRRSHVTSSLLVAQVMMSLVLLVGAGLFMRTLVNLRSVDPGFDAERLVLFTIDPSFNQYNPAKTTTLYQALATKLRALPGVSSVSFSSQALLDGSVNQGLISAGGAGRTHFANKLVVAPDFFRTMGIPVRIGTSVRPARQCIRAEGRHRQRGARQGHVRRRESSGPTARHRRRPGRRGRCPERG